MAIFVASEATLFATLIGTYFYLRFKTSHWPPPGVPEPSSPSRSSCSRPRRDERPDAARRARGRAGRLGAARRCSPPRSSCRPGTSRSQVHDLPRRARTDFAPTDDAYSSIYYTLLGADHAHVALGLLFNLWLLCEARARPDARTG